MTTAACQYCHTSRPDLVPVRIWVGGELVTATVCPEKGDGMNYPDCALAIGYQDAVDNGREP